VALGGGVTVEFRSEARADHVRAWMSGRYSHAAVLPLCERCFEAAAAAGRDALLVDARGITGREPTMVERYEWAVRIAELQARHEPRIRVALLGHEPLIHPERFGEIVASNRGAVVRAFTDEAEALEWLLGRAGRS
jgi:hypothetical protein